MKKFTFMLIAIAISTFIFAQQSKFKPLSAIKKVDNITLNFESQNQIKTRANTDTLLNPGPNSTPTVYGFGENAWGFWTGHNEYGWQQFAEKFTAPAAGDLNELIYVPAAVYDAGSGNVTFKVWGDNSGVPGAELASKAVNLADITSQALNTVTFDSPIAIDGVFYCGYEITYNTPVDTFAMAQTGPVATNTFMFNNAGTWTDMPTATQGGISGSSLYIGACVNIVFTEPHAELNPTSWNAGNVEINGSSTSGTFTLTNTGSGTLTVTNITGLNAPFTSTFTAGDVSLATDASYTFTFDFNPTAEGAFTNTVQIETNGGNLTIELSGNGTAPITGNMDGGFENNVNDFDLTFAGWVQHDEDGQPTYGIQDVTFTNSGYTGSFIAFNPSQAQPSQLADIPPFEGDRLGACFDAIPNGSVTANNDWLITPQSEVIVAGATFKAQVRSNTDQYGLERYAIWVSTTNTDIASFTKISEGSYVEAPIEWTAIEYDLSAYAGSQIYVAVQCVSADAFVFFIDNIMIDNTNININDKVMNSISIYPNPANNVLTVANAESSNIRIFNMLGEEVANINNESSNQTIDISSLANGTYFVKVGAKTFKFNVVK